MKLLFWFWAYPAQHQNIPRPIAHSCGRNESSTLTASQCSSQVHSSSLPQHLSAESFRLASLHLQVDHVSPGSNSTSCMVVSAPSERTTSSRLFCLNFFVVVFCFYSLCDSSWVQETHFIPSCFFQSSIFHIWTVSPREAIYCAAYRTTIY